MTDDKPMFHLLCGKIAAGKSTLAAQLAQAEHTVLISEDAWLSTLFGDQMSSGQDFVRFSAKLRQIIGPHIADLLYAGTSVVLDFQANTVESRTWMRSILDQTNAAHQFHVLAPPDEVCLNRLRARNASGQHPFQVSDAQFHQFMKHVTFPTEDEGFTLVHHDQAI